MDKDLLSLPSTSDSPTEGSLMKLGLRITRQRSTRTTFTRFVDKFRASGRHMNPSPRG
jgi:hypothetical protein